MARRGCAPRDAASSGAPAVRRGFLQPRVGPVGLLHARRSRAATKTIFGARAPCGLPDPAGSLWRALRVACGAHSGRGSVSLLLTRPLAIAWCPAGLKPLGICAPAAGRHPPRLPPTQP